MTPRNVLLDFTNPVAPVVQIDGQDIADSVKTLSLHAAYDELPQLTLQMTPGHPVQFEGVAHVVQEMPAPPVSAAALANIACEWASQVLEGLDVSQVKAEALASLGFGDDADITAPMFEAIKRAWRQAAVSEEARDLWPLT